MKNIFENITNEEKEEILKRLEAQSLHFKKDDNIYYYLNKINQIVLIEYGTLRLFKIDYDGRKSLVGDFNDKTPFNTVIFSLSNNDFEIVAREETLVTIIDYSTITHFHGLDLPNYYTTFFTNLISLFIEITTERNQRIDILTKTTIREKLLEYFKITSKKMGSKHIYLPFSVSDLADYLAINRSAMSRELKTMREEKLITMKNRKITILYD